MQSHSVKGFTLIEVMITLVIVALLASIVFPLAELSVRRSKERELRTSLWQIREALDSYKRASENGHIFRRVGESGYPPFLQVLVDGVEDVKNPGTEKHKIYFLRRIPRDPFGSQDRSAEQTWGKRSFASSASNPKEGEDVYDVYSLASGTGLNGVTYREW